MNCVSQKRREVWALKIWLCLMMPFLLKKLGAFFTIKIHYFTGYLSLSFFLIFLILDAKENYRGSYAWRSILKGRDVQLYATLFWRLTLMSQSSREPLVASLLRSFRDSLVSQALSLEKDLEKFQTSKFFVFLQLSLVIGSRVEALVVRFTQNVLRLPSRLTREWTF